MRGRMARRRGRLIVACGGDREQVRAVERFLNAAARMGRARRRVQRQQNGFLAA